MRWTPPDARNEGTVPVSYPGNAHTNTHSLPVLEAGRRCPARRAPALGNTHTNAHSLSAREAVRRCPARCAPALGNAHTHIHSLPPSRQDGWASSATRPSSAQVHTNILGDLAWRATSLLRPLAGRGCPPRASSFRTSLLCSVLCEDELHRSLLEARQRLPSDGVAR